MTTPHDNSNYSASGTEGALASSVWVTAQSSPASQRKDRYVTQSTAHPAKMLPAVAAHAIEHYTRPGDLVLDPMCGIGTTLVEAVHAGRRAVGVEYEPHWIDVASANLQLARDTGTAHDGKVFHGDARHIAALLPPEYRGQAALVVTSPPYGPSTHGQVETGPAGVQKWSHRYGNTLDRGNLANIGHHRLLAGFTRILTDAALFLRPGGHIAITIRPWREHAELIDLPAQILACGTRRGADPGRALRRAAGPRSRGQPRRPRQLLPTRPHPQTTRGRTATASDRPRGCAHLPHPSELLKFTKLKDIQQKPEWSSASSWHVDTRVDLEPDGLAA